MSYSILANPIMGGRVRGVDPQGSGAFAASRGTRLHRGIDILAERGVQVYAPCSGTVTRLGRCYQDDGTYRLIALHTDWCEIRLLYVDPSVSAGDRVSRLDKIGTVQDIERRYPGCGNHIHEGVRLKSGTGALRGRGFDLRDETWANPCLLMGFY